MSKEKKYIVGIFLDEEILMPAVKNVRQSGLKIYDVFTPFPVHGLEDVMGLRGSKLHTLGFVAGATGAISALAFMVWINVSSYPINFGGKPFFTLPSYIPITFEATVLFASVSMVIGFLARCGLYPGAENRIFDERTTDDKFAMVFEVDKNGSETEVNRIIGVLNKNGAVEVNIKDFGEE